MKVTDIVTFKNCLFVHDHRNVKLPKTFTEHVIIA